MRKLNELTEYLSIKEKKALNKHLKKLFVVEVRA